MGDIPRELLCLLIRERGISIINDSKNFPNFLTDYFKGDYKKERKCLTDSLLENIPGLLLNKKDNLPYSTISDQLSQILINDLGITPELAKWTVDSWALALGIIQDSNLQDSAILDSERKSSQDYTVSIDSNPPRAKFFLNGIQKGVTPILLKNLEFGRYHIQLIYEGYESLNQEFETRSNIDQNIIVTLMKKPVDSGSITIETFPPDAEIFLNSKQYGRSNKTIWNLSEGYYEIRLSLTGYRDIVRQLQVQQGDNVKLRETFLPKPENIPSNLSGKITVRSTPPYAAVYLDNKFIGNTPYMSSDIAIGNHILSMRLSSYEEFTTQINISTGAERFIHETLKKRPLSFAKKVFYAFCVIGILFLILNLIVPLKPNTAEGWNARGDVYYTNSQYQDALDAYDNAISLDQNYAAAWSNKGYTLNNLARYQEALVAFEKAISLDPNSQYVWYGKGNALINLARYEEALAAYNKAVSIDPNYAFGWINKGIALGYLERYQEALDAFNKAISIDSNSEYAWNGKGVAYEHLGRNQEALDSYNKALEINSNLTTAQSNRQKLLAIMNINTLAQTKIRTLKQIEDLTSEGSTLADADRYEEAIQYYDQGLALIGNDNDIEKAPLRKNLLSLKVFALNKLGRINEATQVSKLITQN